MELSKNIYYKKFIEEDLNNIYIQPKEFFDEFFSQMIFMLKIRLSTIRQIENIIYTSPESISKSQIGEIIPHISNTTIEKYLGDLVRNGLIEKVGKAQNIKYVKK